MMPKLVTMVIVLFVSWSCMADEFYLKSDSTGKTNGPFTSDGGSKVVLDGKSYTVVTKTLSPIEKKLSSIMIPEVEFRNANINDAILFTQSATVEYDKAGGNGVNIALTPLKETPKQNVTADKSTNTTRTENLEPAVTISLRNVSALDLIKAICENTGYKYKVSEKIVTLYKE
jgi:hypothetical protein